MLAMCYAVPRSFYFNQTLIKQSIVGSSFDEDKRNYFCSLQGHQAVQPTTWRWGSEESMLSSWSRHTQLMEAAGGIVHNQLGRLLVIFRNGMWDLPKGKVERGETCRTAAIREVYEETGIDAVISDSQARCTFHLYGTAASSNFILKKTYWYLMQAETASPIPQTEEGIERALFVDKDTWKVYQSGAYKMVQDLVKEETIFD